MKDDGYRLSFSISEDGFSISDNVSGKCVIFVRGNFTTYTLEKEVVELHIHNLIEALESYDKDSRMFTKIPALSLSRTVIVRENKHYDWSLGFDGKGATLKDNIYTYTRGFEHVEVLNAINKVYSILLSSKPALEPRYNIVRRIADVGVLVWVYKGNSVVVYESNIQDFTMTNCLVNGQFYEMLLVSVSGSTGMTNLLTSDLQPILEVPTDKSILNYYKTAEELIK